MEKEYCILLWFWQLYQYWNFDVRETNHLGTNWKIPGRSMLYSDQTAVKYFMQCCILISCITVAKNWDYCFVIRNRFYFHEHLNENWSVSVSRGVSYAEDSKERCVRWALWLRSEECGKGVSLFPYGICDLQTLCICLIFISLWLFLKCMPFSH